MAALRLRDRDAILTREGLIFRVLGYSHPATAYICDAEYASQQIFESNNPRAFRNGGQQVFYKFYGDEGWSFIQQNFPQYLIFHEMIGRKVLGIKKADVSAVRKPDERLAILENKSPKDELCAAAMDVLELIEQCSTISLQDFGVFGSILHGFHHPRFSDIDFIIYGKKKTDELRDVLDQLYEDSSSLVGNEFETSAPIDRKHWRFKNYTPDECLWHQRRKFVYGLYKDSRNNRVIKTEFEPVKAWIEIQNEYDRNVRIVQKGWVKMIARVDNDTDGAFMPSVYGIEPQQVLYGPKEANEAELVVSYLEEFRLQVFKDELVYLEGNLETVEKNGRQLSQVTLTYGLRYYEQVLKCLTKAQAQRLMRKCLDSVATLPSVYI